MSPDYYAVPDPLSGVNPDLTPFEGAPSSQSSSQQSNPFSPPASEPFRATFSDSSSHTQYDHAFNPGVLHSLQASSEVQNAHFQSTYFSADHGAGGHSDPRPERVDSADLLPTLAAPDASSPSPPPNPVALFLVIPRVTTYSHNGRINWTPGCEVHPLQHQEFPPRGPIHPSEYISSDPGLSTQTSPLETKSHLPDTLPDANVVDSGAVHLLPESSKLHGNVPQGVTAIAKDCTHRIDGPDPDPAYPPIAAPDTLPTPSSPSTPPFPTNWTEIPQNKYGFGDKQADFEPSESIDFRTKDCPGINLRDALKKKLTDLEDADDPIPQTASASSCRIQFTGYPIGRYSCQKIHMLNWTQPRKPIKRSKLAHEVAKKLSKYLGEMATTNLDGSVDDRWKVGKGCMHIDNMFLVKLISVSKGSLQPEIWVADPSVPHVPTGERET